MARKSVLIIGAGPAGMAQCNAFADAKMDVDVTCFEMGSEPGGLWTYTEKTGDVHHSMYRYHQTNGLNEMLEFPNYAFAEHFGHSITSYPPRAVMLDYLQGWIKKYGGDKYITLNRKVIDVAFDSESKQFKVISRDTKKGHRFYDSFDHVVCCTGHFSVPNYPKPFKGIEEFKGIQIHAHNFRDAATYKGMDLMMVGNGYSGEDIAMQCVKFGAKSATVAYRTAPMGHDFGDYAIEERKLPAHFDCKSQKFVFADGSTCSVDGIVYCTGYKHHFPFMSEELKLKTNNRLVPNTLWKGILWPDCPQLMYLAVPDQYYTFSAFFAQAQFVCGVVDGRVKIPSKEEMLADTAKWQTAEDNLGEDHNEHHILQYKHTQEAAALAGAKLRDDTGHFKQWMDDRHHDILTYRDQTATSSVDASKSLKYCLPWTMMFTDDKTHYLAWCAAETKRIKKLAEKA